MLQQVTLPWLLNLENWILATRMSSTAIMDLAISYCQLQEPGQTFVRQGSCYRTVERSILMERSLQRQQPTAMLFTPSLILSRARRCGLPMMLECQHQAEAWQDRDINNGSISSNGYPLTDVPIWLKGGDDSLVLSETTPRLSVSACGTYTFHWEN